MIKKYFFLLFALHVFNIVAQKTVFLAILARNKAHTLPLFLHCIENLEYEKKSITIYINTNDNSDNTEEILEKWIILNKEKYNKIIYENHITEKIKITNPHEWNSQRFSILSKIRNKSLQRAMQEKTDFYFVVDCDNFIAPETLQFLVAENKPIIAPMLLSIPEKNDRYSNFFCSTDKHGYYKHHEYYDAILNRTFIGTFKVPVVHCTYLIKQEYISSLNYQDGSEEYEFVIFSRIAQSKGISQFICNKKHFGFVVHFYNNVTLAEEKERLKELLMQLLDTEFFSSCTIKK